MQTADTLIQMVIIMHLKQRFRAKSEWNKRSVRANDVAFRLVSRNSIISFIELLRAAFSTKIIHVLLRYQINIVSEVPSHNSNFASKRN